MVMQLRTPSSSRNTAALLHKAARTNKYLPESDQEHLQGFIYHPTGYPLECRRLWFKDKNDTYLDEEGGPGSIGLCFVSDRYIKPGTMLEISITLRNEPHKEPHKFCGKVVLIKSQGEHYEIGLWLANKADSARIRIVEQICHIEAYLQHKRYREGPFISRERATEEWISRFASTFPSL